MAVPPPSTQLNTLGVNKLIIGEKTIYASYEDKGSSSSFTLSPLSLGQAKVIKTRVRSYTGVSATLPSGGVYYARIMSVEANGSFSSCEIKLSADTAKCKVTINELATIIFNNTLEQYVTFDSYSGGAKLTLTAGKDDYNNIIIVYCRMS